MSRSKTSGVGEFFGLKEDLELALGAGDGVATVNRVSPTLSPKRARMVPASAFFRVGCAHDLAIQRDRVLTLKRHQHHGPEVMKIDEFAEEGTALCSA